MLRFSVNVCWRASRGEVFEVGGVRLDAESMYRILYITNNIYNIRSDGHVQGSTTKRRWTQGFCPVTTISWSQELMYTSTVLCTMGKP